MHNRKRRTAGLAASAAVVALVAAGCGGGGSSTGTNSGGSPVKGGTLNMLGVGDTDYMDPNVTYYSAGYTVGRMYSRQLFSYPAVEGKTTDIVPDVATEIPTTSNGGISKDGLTVTIHLRDGVMWNTKPARAVTAADFVRGIKRTCNPIQPFGNYPYGNIFVGYEKFCSDFTAPYSKPGAKAATPAQVAKYIDSHDIPGVQAKDDHTLVLKLVRPAGYIPNLLGLSSFGSAAPVEVMKYAPGSAELGKHQVSDGPYQIDSYDPTKSVQLSRNPAWKASTDPVRKAYVDKISISENGQQDNIQQQLQTNTPTADMEWDTFPLATQVPGLKSRNDKDLTISQTSSSNPYVIYNWHSPNNGGAMKNIAFRQALSYGINRDNIIQVLGGKLLNTPLDHVLPKVIGGFDMDDMYPYSLSKSKSMLSQAGVKKPVIKVLYRNESNGSTKTFETLQQDLTKAGFTVKGVQSSNADFYTKYLQQPSSAAKGDWDLAIAGWGADWFGSPGALTFMVPLFDGTAAFPPAGSNYGFYENPKTDALIKQASQEPDTSKAADLWKQADEQIMKDAAFFPLTSPNTANYHSSHVHGAVYMDLFQNYDPTNVWIDKAGQD